MTRYATFLALCLVVLTGPVLVAQVTTATTGLAPTPDSANEWGGALVWAFFSSSALEWLKRNQTFSVITERTAWFVQRTIGIALAVAAALGVHWSFDPQAGRLVVEGLIWSSMWTLGTESVRQWVLQELTYRTAIKTYRPQTTG